MIVSCCLGGSSCTRQFWCNLDNRQIKCLIIFYPKTCMYSSIYITSEYSHGLVNCVKIGNSPLNHCQYALTHDRLFQSVLKNADVLETVPYSFAYSVLPCTGQHEHCAACRTLQRNSHPMWGQDVPTTAQQVPNYQHCISLTRYG